MPSKYTYPDSEVLRNKFGLQDSVAAHTMETRLAYVRVADLVENPVQGNFNLEHLLEINRRMLQDMYEWAGKLRDVPTYTTTTQLVHCLPEHLKDMSASTFRNLHRDNLLQGMDDNQFNDRLAHHWGEMTALHPSLNGNTRSQRVFVDQLAQQAGRSIDWAAVNQNSEAFKTARLIAHAGNHLPLRDQLARVVRSAGRQTSGIELAGPAVDPNVTKAALSGLPVPGAATPPQTGSTTAQRTTTTKERTSKPRGPGGQDLG
jgi:cell filamentation protein